VLLFPRLSVIENVESGARARGARETHRTAQQVLEWLGLSHLAEQRADTLPFGAERRVGIGRAIATRPLFLLMDEPAAGLNDAECADLAQLIQRIHRELACGILLIEHRISLVFSLCHRVQVLERGRTLAVGTPEQIRRDAQVQRAYLGEAS
jgi:branched-chain amino acid transport system ATP-binding protein